MNMAFTAGCFFILQCIFLMDISVADPLIYVSPTEINLGITSAMDINCTFSINNHPDMAALISLVLSRANATGQQFEELAAITQFTPTSVTLLTQEKVSATGVHSQTGESFLHLSWQHPTALQGGIYQCSALGVGMIGHNVDMTNISSVTVYEANLNDIFQILHELEMHEASMQQQILTLKNDTLSMEQQILTLENDKLSMEQNIQTLQSDKISMEHRFENLENYTQYLESNKISIEKQIADLERNNSHLEGVVASLARAHVDLIGSNDTKSYFVSSYDFIDINESIEVCKSLGGQLAVIDNQDEFTVVQGFLNATSGIMSVAISGSREKTEGNWVLPETDTPLPFTSWGLNYPDTDNRRNCLWLGSGIAWSMWNSFCHNDPPFDAMLFMCEI